MFYKAFLLFITFVFSNTITVNARIDPEVEDFNGTAADTYDWSKHPCRRTCQDDTEPMVCEYVFVVESFTTMSKACYDCPRNITDCSRPHCIPADGNVKPVYVVNRLLPGPSVEVCKNDVIKVEVRNALRSGATSIHWHGIRQKENPYMDGVPYVTQCPITPGQRFLYTFNASKSGTYLWHSHIGGQRTNGLFGKLIVRAPPKEDTFRHLYDFDHHSLAIIDWKEQSEDDFYVVAVHVKVKPFRTVLINGMGRHKNFASDDELPLYTPSAVFNVKQGYRYRFRLINAGADDCPMQVSIDNHTMQVISLDANDVEPIEVDTLFAWPGERYDFILNANQSIDNYWIRFRGYGRICNNIDPTKKIYQGAILRYENAQEDDPKSPLGWNYPNENFTKILNSFFINNETRAVNLNQLKTMESDDIVFQRDPDHKFYFGVDTNFIDNYEYQRKGLYGVKQVSNYYKHETPQINHLTFKYPSVPLLPQRDEVDSSMFCNATSMADKNCSKEHCICSHVNQVKLHSVVEVVLVDEGINGKISVHPFHLHGYFFRIVGFEQLNGTVTVDRVKQLDREGKIQRNLITAPLKDTMRIPKNGYVVIRFYADNPGYWIFHCHIEQHTEQGLAMIFKVGEHEEMPPVPEYFPTCKSYVPK